jgi:hypothetical protein
MHPTASNVRADRGGSAGSPAPFPPLDHHHNGHETPEAAVPPAELERPRGLLGRLLEVICKPGEANFDNP